MSLNPQSALLFISLAIDLRDNHASLDDDTFNSSVSKLAESGFMSGRQLSRICGNRISHTTATKMINKTDRNGGKLNPIHLEDLRKIIFAKSVEEVDYELVKSLIDTGTSQVMMSRITGIPQSTISRKTKNGRKLVQLQG